MKITRLIVVIVAVVLAVFVVKVGGEKLYTKYLYMTHPEKYNNYVVNYSEEFGLDPMFVRAIIKTESNFNPEAISNVGAKGLMQITDETGYDIAKKLNYTNFTPSMLYNPKVNIEFGTYYLKSLVNQFNNDPKLVIAAYNAGGGNVRNWLSNSEFSKNGVTLNYIPFNETRAYVKTVLKNEEIYKKLY